MTAQIDPRFPAAWQTRPYVALRSSREVAAQTGLTLDYVRDLAPRYAQRVNYFGLASEWLWLWDDDAMAELAKRRKSPGSGRRKETK